MVGVGAGEVAPYVRHKPFELAEIQKNAIK
jgi:hypothetical protein